MKISTFYRQTLKEDYFSEMLQAEELSTLTTQKRQLPQIRNLDSLRLERSDTSMMMAMSLLQTGLVTWLFPAELIFIRQKQNKS